MTCSCSFQAVKGNIQLLSNMHWCLPCTLLIIIYIYIFTVSFRNVNNTLNKTLISTKHSMLSKWDPICPGEFHVASYTSKKPSFSTRNMFEISLFPFLLLSLSLFPSLILTPFFSQSPFKRINDTSGKRFRDRKFLIFYKWLENILPHNGGNVEMITIRRVKRNICLILNNM